GTTVTITGTNFTGTAVNFGGTAAASFTVDTPTQITAVSPAHAPVTVDITVTTVGGTSATSAADEFTFDAPPTVTVEQAVGQADPTHTSPIHFTATFSEPVTGFTDSDVSLGGT